MILGDDLDRLYSLRTIGSIVWIFYVSIKTKIITSILFLYGTFQDRRSYQWSDFNYPGSRLFADRPTHRFSR
jgi:hypothetical protein